MEDSVKQAKLKALSLLTDMDRTEVQLRQKLKQKFHEDDVVEQAMEYVKSFGYVNDTNYARRFVESRKKTKSKHEIIAMLSQKGIHREVVSETIAECYHPEDAHEAICYLVEKKCGSIEQCSDKDKKKVFDYLLRKGFSYEEIRQVIQVSFRNT